jgi:hypothetical protein
MSSDNSRKGFADFVGFMNAQLPVWSVVAVEASAEELMKVEDLVGSNEKIGNVAVEPNIFGDERDECLDQSDGFIPVVEMNSGKWSIVFFSISRNPSISKEKEMIKKISKYLDAKAIYFCGEDNSLLAGYTVFDKGEQLGDEESWEQRENYEETLDESSDLMDVDVQNKYHEANDFFCREDIYIPVCYPAEDDAGQFWLATTKSSSLFIRSVFFIRLRQ